MEAAGPLGALAAPAVGGSEQWAKSIRMADPPLRDPERTCAIVVTDRRKKRALEQKFWRGRNSFGDLHHGTSLLEEYVAPVKLGGSHFFEGSSAVLSLALWWVNTVMTAGPTGRTLSGNAS